MTTERKKREQIERNIAVMAVLHYQTDSLPLNCSLDEFCQATRDWTCRKQLKRQCFPQYRKEILTRVKEMAIERHRIAEKRLEAGHRKVCESNPYWSQKNGLGQTFAEEFLADLESEFNEAEYVLKIKNVEISEA